MMNSTKSTASHVPISTNPYQGLKPICCAVAAECGTGSNFYESLSGIETKIYRESRKVLQVPISTNPYQGLKLKKSHALNVA